ncbi:MAG: HEAT repeat domain-containing protein [Planctomycetes bacterium]|nr:HEAT repeat domain-containing protein [Planctomycetota bacterium]
MNHRVVVLPFVLLLAAGCQTEDGSTTTDDQPASKSPVKTPVKKSRKPTAPQKKVKPPLQQRVYGEWKFAEWSGRIKNINPKWPQSDEVVKGLTALVADDDVPEITRRRAAHTLGLFGAKAARAVPVLIRIFNDSRHSNRPEEIATSVWVLKALSKFGVLAKPATPDLIDCLNDSSRRLSQRGGCIGVLAGIGATDAKAVQALIAALNLTGGPKVSRADVNQLRGDAIDAIGRIGSPASSAIRRLIGLTGSGNEDHRRKAARALGKMRRSADDVLVPLAELLVDDDSPAVCDAAADALADVGTPALPLLLKLLENDVEEVRRRAARAVGNIKDQSFDASARNTAQKALDEALDDEDSWVRMNAIESLWKISGKADVVVPALIEELKNPDRQIRIKAYRFLRKLGSKAASAIVPLKKLLQHEEAYVRSVAARALRSIAASQ